METEWYKLDSAGKLYASTVSSRVSTVFRLSVSMYKSINPAFLQEALEETLEEISSFKVIVKRGVFWYYFEKTSTIPTVSEEHYYPCSNLFFRGRNTFPYRVLYYNKKISLELSHMLTDGTGGIEFLKLLIRNYLKREGVIVPCVRKKISNFNFDNAFFHHYEKMVPNWQDTLDKAYKLPLRLDKRGVYHVTTGKLEIKELKNIAKQYQTSITTYLLALYAEILIDIQAQNSKTRKPITINVPVNLRNFFETNTLKNFFVSVPVTIDPRLGTYSFEDIIETISIELKRYLNDKQLKRLIARGVRGERNFLLRALPLFMKDWISPMVHARFGENLYTSSISNLGVISLEEELEKHVERFEFYPPPSIGNKIKAGVISYKDDMYITFGNLSNDRLVERMFFRKLVKEGVQIKIETNRSAY
ncbi:alcohol acetyltransferase [Terribacillus saccharophilus]|uniref:Alcohol acetyltransferase n=1 Tax=Terribacillus saccharophilus TaxID=361277 RepID=A0A268AEC9_9BACI|nr:alcohol acetyltransferase [Terribacillus saccharophilus]PAD22480.1 alcohol acetyltransferase [Terribacillus saccharophilus]PAF18822.1 alcohol acetyltransferase [Terribacillus saccharophilus]PAF23382.1 alcohol acetyltransferase [Terribacillus saccharophilus]PAF37066.1 alcohol acetyltransferase [Terribacillus saccharophilus]PAF40577.1 alcohol acetyltransferase [Terribacillus saccharophilus]